MSAPKRHNRTWRKNWKKTITGALPITTGGRGNVQPLTAASDNVLMWQLGEVAREAGNPERKDVGDRIDRGLILLRLLNEKGFEVIVRNK